MSEQDAASEVARQKMIEAIEAGRVKLSQQGEEYFARAGGIAKEPDFALVSAKITEVWSATGGPRGPRGGIEVSWQTVSAGWGGLTIYVSSHGTLEIDSEDMSRDFCKQVLCKLLDQLPDEAFKK